MTPRPRDPLTPRQRQFVAAYAETLSGTEAAIAAGYSPKTAKNQGSRLAQLPKVRAAIESIIREKVEAAKTAAESSTTGRPPKLITEMAREAQLGHIVPKYIAAVETRHPGDPVFTEAANYLTRYGEPETAKRVAVTLEDLRSADDATLEALAGADE